MPLSGRARVQIDDEVVYVRQAHTQYLDDMKDKLSTPPWLQIGQRDRRGAEFRAFEPCRITHITYAISNDGKDFTLTRLSLALLDPLSPELRGEVFVVDVPPPIAGHVEFVVVRKRFEDACLRHPHFKIGDPCAPKHYSCLRLVLVLVCATMVARWLSW